MQRRLAAIVHADLAGFTRMMEGAETRTFRHLKSAQIEVWRPAIDAGSGRLVGTAGDAMLAEFGSAVTAVGAAIDIQERMARFNEALAVEQRMLFRVGVHLGEVIVDDEDQNIFGDGVNLAARIQSLAEPGGIAVSRAVRDLVELRVEYAFVDGGEHQLKNVSRAGPGLSCAAGQGCGHHRHDDADGAAGHAALRRHRLGQQQARLRGQSRRS